MKPIVTDTSLKQYAELAVRLGINLQKGQPVVIRCPVEGFAFARIVQKTAYIAGASNVMMDWVDSEMMKEFYLHASEEAISNFPDSSVVRFKEWDDTGAAYINIITKTPDLFNEVCPSKISRFTKAMGTKLKAHYQRIRTYENRWCIIAIPSKAWAKKIFPHLMEAEALEYLYIYGN